jgi:hypothetical protein
VALAIDGNLLPKTGGLAEVELQLTSSIVRVAKQQQLIDRLRGVGHDTTQAAALLENLLEAYRLHQDSRARILAEPPSRAAM